MTYSVGSFGVAPRIGQLWHKLEAQTAARAAAIVALTIAPVVVAPDWRRGALSARCILREVAAKHGVSVADITGPRRDRRFVAARFEAAYRMHEELQLSYPMIGRLLGGRDHTSALHAVRTHAERNGLCGDAP